MKHSNTFFNIKLNENQKVVCFIGPSGTGKSFCSGFLEQHNFVIARQITTRAPRIDDKHYVYYNHKQFVDELSQGKIIGYYSGDKQTLTGGNGYGYNIEYISKLLNSNKNIILFPSAYELESEKFTQIYGDAIKICLTFKNPTSVAMRALQAGKNFSNNDLSARINSVIDLTRSMVNYQQMVADNNFHIIYSDNFGPNIERSKFAQLKIITEAIGLKIEDSLITEYLTETKNIK